MAEKIVALVAVLCLFILIVKCCDRSEDLNSNSSYPIYEESTETSTTQADSNSNKKETKKNKVTYTDLSKFPAVKRDLALLIDKSVKFAEIQKIASESERKLLKDVVLFDVYEGKNLPAGKKSYAVSFFLEDETKTLNDKQIDAIMKKIQTNLEQKLGAQLR